MEQSSTCEAFHCVQKSGSEKEDKAKYEVTNRTWKGRLNEQEKRENHEVISQKSKVKNDKNFETEV